MAQGQSKAKRFVLWTTAVILGLLIAVIVGIGLYIRISFASFYDQATDEFSIPGNGDGFVCQDIDYYDKTGSWLFSGYSSNDGPSPLYRRDAKGNVVQFFAKTNEGVIYDDHGSGITSTDEFVFLTCDDGYLVFEAEDVMAAKKGEYVRAIDRVDLEITPAFLNIENDALYVGTFHRIPEYPARESHYRIASDGTRNGGIALAYPESEDGPYGFDAAPLFAYSLPDHVQGICILPNDDIVLSRSWAIEPSSISVYSKRLGCVIDELVIGDEAIPLHILDRNCLLKSIAAPPMTEGIEYVDGKVYISDESASDKYFFGKLYGAGEVYSIPM